MERAAKRARMSLPVAPHPVAALLDDAFRAFFLKQEAKKRPILPAQPFNAMKVLKELNEEVDSIGTCSDGSVYADLPYDVQGLVRSFTPHPTSLLLKDARYVWRMFQHAKKNWPLKEEKRILICQRYRERKVREQHHDWLYYRMNWREAMERSRLTWGDILEHEFDDFDDF
jgi:hypothetical protein